MPELPEVETVRKSLECRVVGLAITLVNLINPKEAKAGEYRDFSTAIQGKKFTGFLRRGKYLIAQLEDGISIVVHLRMTGRWVYCAPQREVPKHTHIIFQLSDGNELRFTDVRRFGGMELIPTLGLATHPGLAKLGVEPLSEEFSAAGLREIVRGRKGKIKSLILDQTRLAGLGNIYADEALFLAGIHPERVAETISSSEVSRLYESIRSVLAAGIANKGTSFRDYVDGEGQQGSNQISLNVYGRSGLACTNCGAALAKLKVGGRTSVYCPNCQRN